MNIRHRNRWKKLRYVYMNWNWIFRAVWMLCLVRNDMSREMKDSGVEWLGEIPKGWNVKKGKALYSITTGKLDANAEEPTGIYPFFTCSMFPKKINQYAFDCEALLVAGNGVVGFTQYYKGKFNAYQRTYVLSDFHNIYPLFLKYYVSNNLKREVEQSSVGSVIQFIKLGDLQNFNIAFPEYKEQEKITEYLEMKCQKIDHIIEKTKSSIVEYKKFKQSIITKAVTQGISNEQALKESGVAWIGNIPESWKFTQLRHCVSIRSGITLGKKYSKDIKLIEIPYLRVANVQDGYVDTNDIAVLRVSKDEIEKYSLSAGEVLMTEGGDRDKLGRGCVWDGRIAPCLHQNHIFAVKVKEKLLNPYYLEYLTVSAVGRTYFDVTAVKTTNLACTSSSKVLAFTIPLPSLDEQNEIVSYLKEKCNYIDDVITKKEQFVNELENYKKSLIYEYVTGKKEVPEP